MGLCVVPFLSSFLSVCAPAPPLATGYVEGEYLLIAPVAAAEVRAVHAARGDHVAAGAPLVDMEVRDAEIALAQADADLARTRSQLEDLRVGRRPEEIRVIEAGLTSARAAEDEAQRTEARTASLAMRGAATESQLDDARTAASVASAQVAEGEANLAVARLPARPDQIAAAEAAVRGAEAVRAQAVWALGQRKLAAPAAGTVTDILRQTGEIAGPTAPVLQFLPDDGIKLRLYIPEAGIAGIAPGTTLAVHCDACPTNLTAHVSWIAEGPEFTPPVIYSLQNRQKLVYMIEARPDAGVALKPGQIVDVTLPGAGAP